MRVGDTFEPNNLRLLFSGVDLLRRSVADARADAAFVRSLVRALVPLGRFEPRGLADVDPLPPWRPLAVPSLAGRRVGLVASGGSGALASLVGVRRAFAEAGIEPAGISACSGAMLFAALWAMGLSADEMRRFWLELPRRDYLDPDWRSLATAPLRRLRRFGGLLRGEAIERTFERRFPGARLGDTRIPLSTVAWNIDLDTVEQIGSVQMPELPLSRAVRIAVSLPVFVEPVVLGGHRYGDGGVIDIFPVRALVDHVPPFDVVFGLNCYYPRDFRGEDVGDWYERTWALFRCSGQVRYGVHLELARQQMALLGRRLVMLHPVPYDEVRGAQFYQSFVDRTGWPRYMRLGYDSARAALERLAATERPAPEYAPAPG